MWYSVKFQKNTSSVVSATTAVAVSAVLGAVVVVVVGGSYETTGARGAPYL